MPSRLNETPDFDPDRRPWEPMPGESRQAFAAFEIYLHLDPRNRAVDTAYKVYQQEGLGKWAGKSFKRGKDANGTWKGWSVKFSWVARAMAHDAFLARERVEAARVAVREMQERQIKDSRGVQALATFGLSSKTSTDSGKAEIKALPATALTWMLDCGQRMEQRAARIDVEEEGPQQVDLPGLDQLPTEEKLKLASLLFQAAGTKPSAMGLRELPGVKPVGKGQRSRIPDPDEDEDDGDPDVLGRQIPSARIPLPGIVADDAEARAERSRARRRALPGFSGPHHPQDPSNGKPRPRP